jgi:hypothetical protein
MDYERPKHANSMSSGFRMKDYIEIIWRKNKKQELTDKNILDEMVRIAICNQLYWAEL